MPYFDVEALEKFVVRTTYRRVEADTPAEAAERCKGGQEAYDEKEIEEGDEEWVETVSVELSDDQSDEPEDEDEDEDEDE